MLHLCLCPAPDVNTLFLYDPMPDPETGGPKATLKAPPNECCAHALCRTFAQVGDGPSGKAVPLQPGQVAVIGGHTLEFATGGALRATHPRVMVRRRLTTGCRG